ncbi:MAG: class SAM-dependent methyltransferase [Ignavibacteria bacterium]|nr:class SAM-dependent methyltransferase [Ignavibacteria bacterium]
MLCRICNSGNTGQFKFGKTQLIQCNDCKAVYLSQFPSNEYLDEYYSKQYQLKKGDSLFLEQRRLHRLPEQLFLINKISHYIKTPARLLDFGCDRGYFIDEARRHGFDCCGTEQSISAVEYCHQTGLNVRKDIDDFDGKFDVITMWHCLEHLPNPNEIIFELKSRLNPNGMLFVRVPAFDSFWAQTLKERWIWFQHENHLFHYTCDSLNNLFHQNGFRTEFIYKTRPNTRLTTHAYKMSRSAFRQFFGLSLPLRKRIGRIVERITGVEVFSGFKMD